MSERCTACDCAATSKQVVFGHGNPKAKIVSVGEAPDPDEDKEGEPWVGRVGKLHDELLASVQCKRADIWVTNVAKCFPGRDVKGGIGKPSERDVETCTKLWLFKELKAIKPIVILAWGATACKALLQSSILMNDLVGREFETEYGMVIPLYHPSYLLQNPNDETARRHVTDALQRAMYLASVGVTGTYIDQVRSEKKQLADGQHHQDDKQVMAALESKSNIFKRNPWRDEREYTTAWSDGSDVVLVYKERGKKQFEMVKDFDWYFYLRTDDVVKKLPTSLWAKHLRSGLVSKIRPDPVNPEWTQVFAYRHIVRTAALREHLLESFVTMWNDDVVKKYEHDQRLRDLLDEIESYRVQHFEADLTPSRRFMTDYDIKIMSEYDEMYMDIETDDTLPLIDRKTLHERRILSIAWECIWADKTRKPTTGFLLLQKESDRAEREMLEHFSHDIGKIDIMYAWNGNNFDFPILRHRMRRYKVRASWETTHTIDLLRTWMRYFQRGATINTSYSLQNIATHILKTGKIDWREIVKARGQKRLTFLELYRQHPDVLEEYNRFDAHLLVELEKFTGFAKIDQVFSRIGNCFARDYHITTKIDSLLLKRGKQDGIHFKTKKVRIMAEGGKAAFKKAQGWEAYEGAYVLDPKVGIFENVAAMDFKSLYPSVMVAFNISPETYISDEEARMMSPDSYIVCPTGAKFKTDVKGFVPMIFVDTGEKRKVYQKLQADEPVGSDLFLLYYRLGYSFKRLGLSFYGDMGNVESRYFNPHVAEAVTLSGQYVLKQALEFAEREGVTPLYGDTDSLYVQLPADQGAGFVNRCNLYIKDHLKKKFGVPDERFVVELEYENYFSRMFFVRKKRYAGLMTMYKGKEASFTEIKGFECMRSDGIEYARQMQKTLIEMIIRERRSREQLLRFLMSEREKVINGVLPLKDITITKAVTKPLDSYKAKGVHVHIAQQYRDAGGEFYVGMKVPYIITGEKPKLQAVHAENFTGEYDKHYYWNKITFPPVYRILAACYPDVSWHLLFSDPKLQDKQRALKLAKIENGNGNGHDEEHDHHATNLPE